MHIATMDFYYAAHEYVTKGLSSSNIHKDTTAFLQWDSFCQWLQIPPDLHGIKDPVQFLQIFSHKLHTVFLVVKIKAIQKQIMENTSSL